MFFKGCGWEPRFVEGDEPQSMHQKMAAALDWAVREIQRIQEYARSSRRCRPAPLAHDRPAHPQGLDRPQGSGRKNRGGLLARPPGPHPRPRRPAGAAGAAGGLAAQLSPRGALPDENGALIPSLQDFAPRGQRRMGANPHANGGLLLRDLRIPDFREYAEEVPAARCSGDGGHGRFGRLCAGPDVPEPGRAGTSASSGRTRPPPIAWSRCSRPAAAAGPTRSTRRQIPASPTMGG